MVLDAEDVFAKVGYAMLGVNNVEFQSACFAWPVMSLVRVIDMLCTPLPLVLQRIKHLTELLLILVLPEVPRWSVS